MLNPVQTRIVVKPEAGATEVSSASGVMMALPEEQCLTGTVIKGGVLPDGDTVNEGEKVKGA